MAADTAVLVCYWPDAAGLMTLHRAGHLALYATTYCGCLYGAWVADAADVIRPPPTAPCRCARLAVTLACITGAAAAGAQRQTLTESVGQRLAWPSQAVSLPLATLIQHWLLTPAPCTVGRVLRRCGSQLLSFAGRVSALAAWPMLAAAGAPTAPFVSLLVQPRTVVLLRSTGWEGGSAG